MNPISPAFDGATIPVRTTQVRRRVLAVAGPVLLIVGLAACGADATTAPSTSDRSTATSNPGGAASNLGGGAPSGPGGSGGTGKGDAPSGAIPTEPPAAVPDDGGGAK